MTRERAEALAEFRNRIAEMMAREEPGTALRQEFQRAIDVINDDLNVAGYVWLIVP